MSNKPRAVHLLTSAATAVSLLVSASNAQAQAEATEEMGGTAVANSAVVSTATPIHETTLDNGLQVIVVESRSVPIVTIELAVHAGAFVEPAELDGLSHLYEHMFFKANESLPSQEAYMARQRELGMVWNGTTGNERVNYFFTLRRPNLRSGMEFMRDAIVSPLLLEDELIREREVVLGEYDRNESSPGYFLYDRMSDLLWGDLKSRKNALGVREVIQSATVEQMAMFRDTYYIPNNSVLILSGDISAEEGFAMAEEIFSAWEPAEDPFIANPIPEFAPLEDDVASVVTFPYELSLLAMGWHGPNTEESIEHTYAADVFSFILSQEGSTFQQNLVESGIALQAGLGYSTQRHVGPIQLTAVTLPGQEEALSAALLGELERFDDPDYFSDEQLATAKRLLAVHDLYTREESVGLAHTVSYWWASASLDYYRTYIDELSQVTREDILEYVQTYIQGQPRAAVLLTSEENATAQSMSDGWLLDLTDRNTEVSQ